ILPGILTPKHQSNAKIAVTAMAMRSPLKRIRLDMPRQIMENINFGAKRVAVSGECTRLACTVRRRAERLLRRRKRLACIVSCAVRFAYFQQFSAGGRKQHAGGLRSPGTSTSRDFFAELQSTQKEQ